jgi:hypothetical protein
MPPPTYSDYQLLKTLGNYDHIKQILSKGYIPYGNPCEVNGQSMQAFVLPVEKEQVEKVSETSEAEDFIKNEIQKLVEIIKSTNNGYLFNPSQSEITLAKKYPDVFFYTHYSAPDNMFPHRIALK